MSSLVQKFNQSGYRKYRHAQYHGIVHGSMQRLNACSAKVLLMIELTSSRSLAMGSQRVRVLISKGCRAHTMLETSNSLQTEPQGADLNMRRELVSHSPRPVFICHVGAGGFINRQSALIAWHNVFKLPMRSPRRPNHCMKYTNLFISFCSFCLLQLTKLLFMLVNLCVQCK